MKTGAVKRMQQRKELDVRGSAATPRLTATQQKKHENFIRVANKLPGAKAGDLPALKKEFVAAFYA